MKKLILKTANKQKKTTTSILKNLEKPTEIEKEKPKKKFPKWCLPYKEAMIDSQIIDIQLNIETGDLELILSNGNIIELHDFILNRKGFKLGSIGIANCIYFSKYEQHKYCDEIEEEKESKYYNFRYKKD